MKNISLIIIIIIVFSGISSPLFAQGGSNYSIFGIGDRNYVLGSKYEGAGGTTIAFPQRTGINLENPAMWSKNTDTRLQMGYKFNQNLVSSNGNELAQNYGGIDGMLGLFNIDTSLGLSFSLGFYGYSNVNSYVATPIFAEKDGHTISGKNIYQSTGGVTRVYFGISVKPIDRVFIGAVIYGNTGAINNNIESVFNEEFTFRSVSESNDAIGGTSYRFGIAGEPINNLTIGAFFEPAAAFDVENELTYQSVLTGDTTFTTENSHELPMSMGFGISYRAGSYLFGADYQTSDYSNFTYNSFSNVSFSNENTISLGIEKTGSNNLSAQAFERVSYRIGFGYKQLYYTFDDNAVNEMSASAGLTIPIKGTAELDAAFVLGQRNSDDENLISETFGKLIFNVSIGDNWFQPFDRGYE